MKSDRPTEGEKEDDQAHEGRPRKGTTQGASEKEERRATGPPRAKKKTKDLAMDMCYD